MELVTCVDSNDPGKGTDCANQMISDGVAAVIIGSNGIIETEWKILHDAGVPVINHSVTNAPILEDTESTFILYDPEAQTVTLPLAVAKRAKADKVSMVVIDVPAATEIYTDETTALFKRNGIDLEIVPAPLGAPDLTPQAQQIVTENPDGVVAVVGHDQFCIPALNGLDAVGFTGSVTTISFCITDAMREAVPAELIKGMRFGSEAPVGSKTDKSMKQYRAALKKYGGADVDPDDLPALTVFQSFGALSLGTKTLQGDPTPAAVIAAMKGMDNEVLPAAGGRVFRCNGKATDFGAAICSVSTISGSLDNKGEVKKYTLENNDPIPD
jgi:branched-chain amino acid transport system substrate-binding protein